MLRRILLLTLVIISCQTFGQERISVELAGLQERRNQMMRNCRVGKLGSGTYDMKGVTLQQLPHAFLDREYAITQGQPNQIIMTIVKDRVDHPAPKAGFVVVVRTHQRIQLQPGLPQLRELAQKQLPDGLCEYRYRFEPTWGWGTKARLYSYPYRTPVVVARTDLPPSQQRYPFSCHIEYEGLESKPCQLNVRVIPSIRGRQPKTFHTGVVSYSLNMSEDKIPGYVSFIKDCGFNAESIIHRVGNVSPRLPKALKDAGILRFWEGHEAVDAISVGRHPIPEGSRLCDFEGKPFVWGGLYRTCPYAIYSKETFYRENLVPTLRKLLITDDWADHIMPNWEPFQLGIDYCFCHNCKREFARYAGLPLQKVRQMTGKQIRARYPLVWMRFSAYAHGKLVRAIQDAMDEACVGTGKKSWLLPEMNVGNVLPGTEEKEDVFGHYNAKNYAHDLPGLCPWGPYDCYDATGGYECLPGFNLNQVRTAEYLQRAYRGCRMYMLVHGYQCNYWVTQPEAIAFETFGNFQAGLCGSFVYHIDGYDARYYAALATVNTQIAESEDFLAQAQRSKRAAVVAVSPVPPRAYRKTTSCEAIQYLNRNTPILYARAFAREKETMVLAGNSWSNAEIYGKLTVKDLPTDTCTVILPDRKEALEMDAKTLAGKGLLVKVSPLAWLRIIIIPGKTTTEKLSNYNEAAVARQMKRDWIRLKTRCDKDSKIIKRQEELPPAELYQSWW